MIQIAAVMAVIIVGYAIGYFFSREKGHETDDLE